VRRTGLGLDGKDEMLDLEGECLLVNSEIGRPASLDHQVPSYRSIPTSQISVYGPCVPSSKGRKKHQPTFIPIKLRNRMEEIQEVPPVRRIQLRHQPRIDQDQLRLPTSLVQLSDLGEPGLLVVFDSGEAGDDLVGFA
jgi:hypothetical protein